MSEQQSQYLAGGAPSHGVEIRMKAAFAVRSIRML